MRWKWGRLRSDADLEEELRAHAEMEADDELASIPWDERRRRAAVKLGSRRAIIGRVRDAEWTTAVDTIGRDVWLGVRSLRRNPVFFVTAVVTLALGIGANTAIFTLLYGLLLRSLPVRDPGMLAAVNLTGEGLGTDRTALPWRLYQTLKARTQAFEDVSAWMGYEVALQERGTTPRQENLLLTSGNGFAELGIRAAAGRLLTEEDERPGGLAEGWPVVVSYGLWQERFGGERSAIGKRIQLSGLDAVIVGVTPAGFHGVVPGMDERLYLPLGAGAALHRWTPKEAEDDVFCWVLARRKRGVSLRQVNAELALYSNEALHGFLPPAYRRQRAYRRIGLRASSARTGIEFHLGDVYGRPLWVMQGLVGVVLVLCCINVGGLQLARAETRRREFAVRAAIGAARWRLSMQCLVESLLVAGLGGALGAVLARACGSFLMAYFVDPNMAEGLYVAPHRMVLLFTALLVMGATVLFGVLPAWYASGVDAGESLKTKSGMAERRRPAAGRIFVPLQIGLSLALVASSALLTQSLRRMEGEPLGFDARHVTIETPPFNELPQRGDALLDVYQRMVDRLEQQRGVEAAAVTLYTPMTGYQPSAEFEAVGEGHGDAVPLPMTYNEVGGGYFRAMGIQLRSGREFRKAERTRAVCLLNEAAAAYLFPNGDALGRYVEENAGNDDPAAFANGIRCRVIGVAADAKYASVRARAPRTVYLPLTKEAAGGNFELVFLMRSKNKRDAVEAYRKASAEIVPTMPLVRFATLEAQLEDSLGSQRLITLLGSFFSGLGVLLSAIGLYGLLAANVARRRGEIGLRMALGARRRAVLRMILREALGLLAAGVVLGGAAMVLAARWMAGMLFDISAADPVTMAATVLVLAVVSLCAGSIPALRAASVDPMAALRVE